MVSFKTNKGTNMYYSLFNKEKYILMKYEDKFGILSNRFAVMISRTRFEDFQKVIF